MQLLRYLARYILMFFVFLGAFVIVGRLDPRLFPIAVLATPLIIFALSRLASRRAVNTSARGLNLWFSGRYSEALKAFESENASPVRDMNVGTTQLDLWLVDESIRSLSSVVTPASLVRNVAISRITVATALKADVAQTEKWLNDSDSVGAGATGWSILAKSILAIRQSQFSLAETLLLGREIKAISGPQRVLADSLLAWCLEQNHGEIRKVDSVALFHEVGPEGLQKVWPEFIEFVNRAPKL